MPNTLYPTDIIDCIYSYSTVSQTGTYGQFQGVVDTNTGLITISGVQVVADYVDSATPGTVRAFTGKMVQGIPVMTSGNIVGVRGEVDYVGASGGFIYGVQGKIIPTGTLSSSEWSAAVFAQLDVHSATINAGQIATVWGDWGTTGATATSMTGARGFAFTNTTANILNAQFYMYGPATNLLELDDNSGAYGGTYISSGGSGAPSGTVHKLAITINGVTNYIVASTVVS